MIEALEEQRRDPNIADLDFEQRLALLVQRQWLWKSNRTLASGPKPIPKRARCRPSKQAPFAALGPREVVQFTPLT
ncbi:MAG: IstB-like ATP-binding domain-containing protein [Verrucomicrobia bacterium]|jgi:hypothetical protein|nr:IstB-like ATP-binding domain-containing protein [Verrucomicrobiota bacterium]OQC65830.1 MAG: hypothetical protein BWX48_02092 [Verrucomicrobia bacterium ADurb.Bin006]MDI9379980.1 hypothetical protein [Verrucomicrobiota bacterium]HNU98875.1 hypothetical protein [Verrucomicrobiota bacterium]HOA60325.1 hypothetical protein [Verrucomicrobiota bacterium]